MLLCTTCDSANTASARSREAAAAADMLRSEYFDVVEEEVEDEDEEEEDEVVEVDLLLIFILFK